MDEPKVPPYSLHRGNKPVPRNRQTWDEESALIEVLAGAPTLVIVRVDADWLGNMTSAAVNETSGVENGRRMNQKAIAEPNKSPKRVSARKLTDRRVVPTRG